MKSQRVFLALAAPLVFLVALSPALADDARPIMPGDNDHEAIQLALIEVQPGGTVLLGEGTFHLRDGLSLDVDGVTVRGQGKYRTILSFEGQEAGGEGLLVTSDNVTLDSFAVEDTKGDGIKSKDVKGIRMLNLRAEWTNGPDETNGAYGLYPVGSKNVLIDGCVAIGASDAGIYVGQSRHIVIRNSIAMDNVAGFEVENSYYADVYDNTAVNNTGGFLVFDLPNLPQQGGHSIRLFNNVSVNNNTPNFAPEGNIVATVPQGLGIMVMANRNVEIFNNMVDGNQSVGLLINTYPNEYDDPDYNPHPRAIHVHDNRFGDNGFAPKDELAERAGEFMDFPLADIVWDGVLPAVYPRGKVPPEDWIYIHDNEGADFIDLDFDSFAVAEVTGMPPVVRPSRDLEPHRGSLPPIEPVELEFGQDSD